MTAASRVRLVRVGTLVSLLLLASAVLASSESHDPQIHPSGLIVYGNGAPRDPIPWAELSRADFRAPDPPPHLASHAGLIGAVSCLSIKLSEDSDISVRALQPEVGPVRYEAAVPAPVFEAVFDRICSWWNPLSKDDDEYLLEHEQLHFDMTEIAARRLARELEDRELVALASSAELALAKLSAKVDIETRSALVELQERQLLFDAQTSVQRSREDQKRWAREVAEDLAAFAAETPKPGS